jgi:hypothetical protein
VEPASHPNGATYIDHVVLLSPDLARTAAALAAIGVTPRGERDSDTYGAPMRQMFFRLGEVILELIGQPDAAGEGVELGAAPPAGERQHVTPGGAEGVERPLAAELAAAADGAVGEGHGPMVRLVQ